MGSSAPVTPPPVVTTPCSPPPPVAPTCPTCPPPVLVTNSCPNPATGSPVILYNGLLYFQLPLLSSMAAGTGSFPYVLNYLAGSSGTTGTDGSVGLNFNYPQNVLLTPSGNNVLLQLGENTQELFQYVSPGIYSSAANNSRSVLTRSGAGTSSDQFTIVSGDGVVSQFSGFYSSITTPGRLLSLTDRFGNVMSFSWGLVGGLVRLASLTDTYGRTSNFTYHADEQLRLSRSPTSGRKLNFQYDSAGRLVAVVLPSVTRGANSNANTFPNGTAYVFKYDTANSRPARQNDLIADLLPQPDRPLRRHRPHRQRLLRLRLAPRRGVRSATTRTPPTLSASAGCCR